MAAVPDHDFAATELGLPSRVDRMRYVITHMLRYSYQGDEGCMLYDASTITRLRTLDQPERRP